MAAPTKCCSRGKDSLVSCAVLQFRLCRIRLFFQVMLAIVAAAKRFN
jgi:hypothetical protein